MRLKQLLIILHSSAQVFKTTRHMLFVRLPQPPICKRYLYTDGGEEKSGRQPEPCRFFCSFYQRVLPGCLLLACFSFYHRGDTQRPGSCPLVMPFRKLGALQVSRRLCLSAFAHEVKETLQSNLTGGGDSLVP